jgi:hypothetical protein
MRGCILSDLSGRVLSAGGRTVERSSLPGRAGATPTGLAPRSLTSTAWRSFRAEVHSRHSLFPPLSVLEKTVPRSRGRSQRASRPSERGNPERTKRSPGRNGTQRTLRPSRTKRTLAGKKNAFLWKWTKRLCPNTKPTETKER